MKIISFSLTLLFCCFAINVYARQDTLYIDNDLQLVSITDSVFVHISWHQNEQFRFPSNGLLIIKNGEAVMVDTPMDNEKTARLYRFVKDSLHANIHTLIIGHFHDDCLGGLAYLQSQGVEAIANALTIEKCHELNLPLPTISFESSYHFNLYQIEIETAYHGAGHTVDNSVVWLPEYKILFGGCLVKTANARSLGNVADAVIGDWETTIDQLLISYPARWIVPGHGAYGGPELLYHTKQLVRDYLKE